MALFEFRQYKVRDERMQDWLDLMQGELIPFAVECGTVFCGSFVDAQDPTAYHWFRRFENEEHRKIVYAAFYESARWTKDLAPRVGDLLIREEAVIRQLVPTRLSPMQRPRG